MPSQLYAIARYFGVTVDWLLGLTDDPEGYGGGLQKDQLTPNERMLVDAYRSGELDRILYEVSRELFAKRANSKEDTPSDVPQERKVSGS